MLRNILDEWHRAEKLPKHTPFSVKGDSVANARLTSIVWFLTLHLGETIAWRTSLTSLINIFVNVPESRVQLLLLCPDEEKPRDTRLSFEYLTTSKARLKLCGENVTAERFEGSRKVRDAASRLLTLRRLTAIFGCMKPMKLKGQLKMSGTGYEALSSAEKL